MMILITDPVHDARLEGIGLVHIEITWRRYREKGGESWVKSPFHGHLKDELDM